MQRSAFIIALFSLLAFFSLTLASPLPVQVNKEVREAAIELGAREVPADHMILHREVITNIDPVVHLEILAREQETSERYVQEVTGETNVARDTQDLEPRICPSRGCL